MGVWETLLFKCHRTTTWVTNEIAFTFENYFESIVLSGSLLGIRMSLDRLKVQLDAKMTGISGRGNFICFEAPLVLRN